VGKLGRLDKVDLINWDDMDELVFGLLNHPQGTACPDRDWEIEEA
jgi:hypothetical protein